MEMKEEKTASGRRVMMKALAAATREPIVEAVEQA